MNWINWNYNNCSGQLQFLKKSPGRQVNVNANALQNQIRTPGPNSTNTTTQRNVLCLKGLEISWPSILNYIRLVNWRALRLESCGLLGQANQVLLRDAPKPLLVLLANITYILNLKNSQLRTKIGRNLRRSMLKVHIMLGMCFGYEISLPNWRRSSMKVHFASVCLWILCSASW